jgi:hypothetical protein
MSKVRELIGMLGAHTRWVAVSDIRAALEADEAAAAKARELPEEVRRHVDSLRALKGTLGLCPGDLELVAWFDAQYPKPKTQAELDAEYLERLAGNCQEYAGLRAIAKRLRGGK